MLAHTVEPIATERVLVARHPMPSTERRYRVRKSILTRENQKNRHSQMARR